MIYSLLGLAAFLTALIGVVVGARQIRSMLARRDATQRPATLAESIEQLQKGLEEAQAAAAMEIVRRGPEAVVAALDATTKISESGHMLHSPAVMRAMAAVGPPAADALGKALGSEKPNVRAAAAGILREMGPGAKGAVGPLAAVVDDEQRLVRWFAADALGVMGPDAAGAVSALTSVVDHPDRFTRRWAVMALGRIGPSAKYAVAALTKAQEEDNDGLVRKAATVALHQINLAEIAAEATARADAETRGLIQKLQSDDEHESVPAAGDLRDLGPQAVDAVPALALALKHQNKWLREAAADALGAIGQQAWPVVPALEEATGDKEPEVRKAAKAALEKIEPKRP